MTSNFELVAPPAIPEEEEGLREYVLKVFQRCNLACDYCFMYEMADQTWRNQPRLMSNEVIGATAQRVGDHALTHGLRSVNIVAHGGEPLLADQVDPEFYPRAVAKFREKVPEETEVSWGIQTNGTLLNGRRLAMLQELGITVGVSLDGDKAAHDKHRLYPNGRGSFEDVAKGITALQAYPEIYSGILMTIDPTTDPLAVYDTLRAFNPPLIEFNLPLGNWTTLPPHHDRKRTIYADWLLPIFDKWYADPESGTYKVRIFDEIMRLLQGQPSPLESLGLMPPRNVVVDTDGSIENVDSLKSTADGMPNTGLNVFNNSFDEALRHPKFEPRLLGAAALSRDCLDCSLLNVCGGGMYAHRYKENGGVNEFRNRSVYCNDLQQLIGHIARRMTTDALAARAGR